MGKETTLKHDLLAVEAMAASDFPFDRLCKLLDIKTNAGREFILISLANARLMDRKQQDYGSRNIARHGSYGCLVRMEDKFERMDNLFKSGRKRKAVNESIEDSFRDLANYGNIALLCEIGRWPNE